MKINVRPSISALVCALAFSTAIGVKATETLNLLRNKAFEQEREAQQVALFRASVDAIKSVRERFKSEFRPSSDIVDILSLRQALRLEDLGLALDVDTLSIRTVEKVALLGGGDPNLLRICVQTPGGGMPVTAPTMQAIFDGVAKLGARSDIQMASYTTFIDDKTMRATVTFSDFCLVVRG